jgi:tetratricopeptide (TPR) repeat protein
LSRNTIVDSLSSKATESGLRTRLRRQGDTARAIAAFTEYVCILPQEPKAQDSLGEALRAAGRFEDAEDAFQKSADLSPQFFGGHEGIAFARFYAGNWPGGRDALAKAKAAATRRGDQMQMNIELAAAALAQKKTAEALQISMRQRRPTQSHGQAPTPSSGRTGWI